MTARRELSRDVWCHWMESTPDESQLEEIDIRLESSFYVGPICELWSPPASFFTLKNLKVLKLNEIMTGIMPASIFLSSLKILHLLKLRTRDFELLSRLISGGPVLETLYLENCFLQDVGWRSSTHCFHTILEELDD
ncbi:unnamed protein product [Linum trigynum]|uniref:Uncharacterized protein n=1 Tax=Linum trigynum TaxID=586398 RepID=A0AAV2FVG3_9ROSI